MILTANVKPKTNPPRNPLRLDPSRTALIRRQFMAEMNKRFRQLRGDIRTLIVEEDVFGLGTKPNPFAFNTRWKFDTDDVKLDKFKEWFQDRIDADILETVPGAGGVPGEPWTDKYISSAYRKGVVRAYNDTHSESLAQSLDFFAGSKEQFLSQAFASPTATSKLRLLSTRAFDQLKGVTEAMGQEMSRILSDGLVAGHHPTKIARDLNKSISTLTRKRALTIARTETIHAHAEGQLDAFTQLGLEDVVVLAEWSTAGDDRVCPLCLPLEGMILKIKEARGILPRHPN